MEGFLMRKILFGLLVVIMCISQTAQAATPSPQWVKNLPAAQDTLKIYAQCWYLRC